jgi:NTP pyrophosphatase (non-canonical NTP hydrolase)
MGEEVGELFKAIRGYNQYYEKPKSKDPKGDVAEEIVDVFNYLLAIANRLDIDLEAAFRKKNARNIMRSWED